MSDDATPTPTVLETGLAQLKRDLAALPPDVDRQLVAVVDDKGIKAGFAVRVGDDWRISGEVEQRWAKQRPDARLVVAKSF